MLAYTHRTNASNLGGSHDVPQNGERNEKFGVYKSLCCEAEIVITEGSTFPECPNHRSLSTTWEPLDFEMIPITVIRKKAKSEPAA